MGDLPFARLPQPLKNDKSNVKAAAGQEARLPFSRVEERRESFVSLGSSYCNRDLVDIRRIGRGI